MNFLGHCLLSAPLPKTIPANLAGDFFKGTLKNQQHYPIYIQNGIKIHRFIDSFTDQSIHIQKIGKIFQEKGIKKVSYIASDILLDHYLSENWNQYTEVPRMEFIQLIFSETDKQLNELPKEFHFVYAKMKVLKWLQSYIHQEGILNVLQNFQQRIPFENNLSDSFQIYLNHKNEINQSYALFMDKIKSATEKFIEGL